MAESTIAKLTEKPDHEKRAIQFINIVNLQIAWRHSELDILAKNATQAALGMYWAEDSFRRKGNETLTRAAATTSRLSDIESAFQTQVSVLIDGDEEAKILEAKSEIDAAAIPLNGTPAAQPEFNIMDWDAPTGDPELDSSPDSRRNPGEPKYTSTAYYIFREDN